MTRPLRTTQGERPIHTRWKHYEQVVVAAVRSPTARIIGFALGVVAFIFFGLTLFRMRAEGLQLVRGHPLTSLLAALGGLAVFQVCAVVALRFLGARSPARIWIASQVAKYLPVPASAAAGMLASSVRHGHTARAAFGLLVRHSVLLVGAATVVGSPSVGRSMADRLSWGEASVATILALLGLAMMAGSLHRSTTLPRGIVAGASATIGWLGVAVGMGTAFAPDVETAVLVGAGYCAGWVAGQIVVPVPAGLGVREAAVLFLLSPVLGTSGALSFAVLSRLLHVLMDGVLVVVGFGLTRFSDPSDDATTSSGSSGM